MSEIRCARLSLVAATVPHLDAELEGPDRLGEVLGVRIPEGWPPGEYDRQAVELFRARLLEGPQAAGWYGWYAVLRSANGERATVVGSGGFFGPPTAKGLVEVGYSVVEEFRRCGYATEIVRGLVGHAFSFARVTRVIAHTRTDNAASIRVLERCGFRRVGPGEEPGTVQYALTASAR